MLGLEEVRRYAWADEDLDLAWTLAVISGRTTGEVIRAHGGDPDQHAELLASSAAHVPDEDIGVHSLLQVRQVGECVVTVENNGWKGKSVDVAERASEGKAFLSVFWNLNANYKVTQAAEGTLQASFDPLTVQHPMPPGETYPDWITDVVFTDDNRHAVLPAVVEHQTGLVVDPAWLTDPAPTYRVSL